MISYIWRRHQHGFEIAEYSNGIESVRLSMTQFILVVLSKQIRFFMCHDAFLAEKICVKDTLKIPCLALIFRALCFPRDLREMRVQTPDPLALILQTVNCVLNPFACFVIGCHFQLQILFQSVNFQQHPCFCQ